MKVRLKPGESSFLHELRPGRLIAGVALHRGGILHMLQHINHYPETIPGSGHPRGEPEVFAIFGGDIVLWPIPDRECVVEVWYQAVPARAAAFPEF